MATNPTLKEWLQEEPFGLTLSSGFFRFFAHCGFTQALEDEGLEPSRVSGSSAGALIAGAYASNAELDLLANRLVQLKRQEFWDPRPGLGLLKGLRFKALLEELLPVTDFEACKVPISISVFDLLGRQTVVLKQGDLVTAIRASCAVPAMFHPVWLNGRPLLDGGILDRPGLAGMPSNLRVLHHFLPSRTRPGHNAIPERNNMLTAIIPNLPPVDPFHLDRGKIAIDRAKCALTQALKRTIPTTTPRLDFG